MNLSNIVTPFHENVWPSGFSDIKITTSTTTTPLTAGTKADTGKVRLDLIPPEIIFALGEILTFGANKYTDRNWEKGMKWGRVFGALMRHMWAWWGGEGPTTKSFVFDSTDLETGRSHLWHACCCIAFLIAYEERNIGEDDRLKA